MKTMKKQNKIFSGFTLLFVFIAFSFACGRITFFPENTNSANDAPKEELTELQREIKALETADFKYIYVFKRKDGGAFDKQDRDFLRANRTPEINRWSATEDKTAYLAGSNYPFLPEHWQNLQKRFIIEDYSKPIAEITVETNANQEVNK